MTSPARRCPATDCPRQVGQTQPACDDHKHHVSTATMNALRKASRQRDSFAVMQWVEQARHETAWATSRGFNTDQYGY